MDWLHGWLLQASIAYAPLIDDRQNLWHDHGAAAPSMMRTHPGQVLTEAGLLITRGYWIQQRCQPMIRATTRQAQHGGTPWP